MTFPGLSIIGDRLNPGFKATRALVESEDIAGLQELAKRQAEAGAMALDLTIGNRGYQDAAFLTEVIRAVQAAVRVPLCFDYPDSAAQETCLRAYDPARAGGQAPILNSIAESRWEMADLLGICPCKVIVMASERMEDGAGVPNRTGAEVLRTARRCTAKLVGRHGLKPDDIYIDVSISTLIADTEGLARMTLDAIRSIARDADLAGVHIVGGLTNIGNMLPPMEVDGMSLRQAMESAFLTAAVPLGLDTVLATPWNPLRILPADHEVLQTFREVIDLRGLDAMRRLRLLWAKGNRGRTA